MIISLAMQKGGSGKTTSALNLAACLRDQGKKVLLIDMDPQANLTQSLGILKDPEPNIYSLLKLLSRGEDANLEDAMIPVNGLDLVPASHSLAEGELELVSTYGRESLLARLTEHEKRKYDFILIDCPPSTGILTINALTCSDYVILPLQAEFLHFKGVQSFMKTYQMVKKQLNGKLEILGLLLTRYDDRKKMNRQVLKQLTGEFGDRVFKTHIRSNIALAQAQEKGIDIFTFNRHCNGATDYEKFTREVLHRI